MQNVKLPIFINGSRAWLKLRPGDCRSWSKFERHDEGATFTAETYRLSADGKTLELELFTDGSDCDGRLTTGRELIAAANPERWIPNYYGELVPDWQDVDSWQRDQFAEAMGY